MSIIATAVSALIEAGVSGDALVAAITKMEAAQAAAALPTRTARQERNARYYEARKARLNATETSESVLIKTDKTVSDGAAAQERVPRPLKETTHEDTPSEAKASSSPRGRRQSKSELCPENFEPSEAHYGKAEAAGRDRAFVHSIAGRMFRWSHQNATRKIAKKSDWSMTLHDWIDRALEEARPQPHARASPFEKSSPATRLMDRAEARRERDQHTSQSSNRSAFIDHEADGRFDREVHEPAGGQARRFPQETPLRIVGSRW